MVKRIEKKVQFNAKPLVQILYIKFNKIDLNNSFSETGVNLILVSFKIVNHLFVFSFVIWMFNIWKNSSIFLLIYSIQHCVFLLKQNRIKNYYWEVNISYLLSRIYELINNEITYYVAKLCPFS